ncbi:hypothetical protein [Brevibacterium spongiae]|uniref:DUF3239 domain-containing protein n=1 Tax=Brevibacterium spongiae TaxID=2909672 RepID=A0ABY5SR88_9MICO|nr:hypothetical protein [Brevibacterium spongiae]UVI35626.1 hypothetical protein L1F31_16125 [Brevibacterium spongiae]
MRKARRHREELGEVIDVFADRPGPKTVTAFVLGWVLFTGLTFINPGETLVLAIAPGIIFAAMFALILLYLSGERLIVCELGILVGSIAPGIRPYVIPFQQITPGSIAGVTGANRYLKEVGLQGQIAQSTLRASWWTKNGVHFVACSAEDARRGRRRFTLALDPIPRSIDARWIWFAGTGTEPPQRAIEAIARAASATGHPQVAQAALDRGVVELTGNPEDAARQLPGHPPVRRGGVR